MVQPAGWQIIVYSHSKIHVISLFLSFFSHSHPFLEPSFGITLKSITSRILYRFATFSFHFHMFMCIKIYNKNGFAIVNSLIRSHSRQVIDSISSVVQLQKMLQFCRLFFSVSFRFEKNKNRNRFNFGSCFKFSFVCV